MATLMKQVRWNTAAANKKTVQGFFKNWSKGDLKAARAAFSKNAYVEYGREEPIARVPFSGKQSPTKFLESITTSLTTSTLTATPMVVDKEHFSAVVSCASQILRTEKKRQIQSLYFGTFDKDGKIKKLVCRPEAHAWEEAFSSHGPSVKGMENKWDSKKL